MSHDELQEYLRVLREVCDQERTATVTPAMGYGPGHGGAVQPPAHRFTPDSVCSECGVHAFDALSHGSCLPVKLNPPYVPVHVDNPGWSGTVQVNTDEPKTCTCPLSGPDGLMARGCTCNGV